MASVDEVQPVVTTWLSPRKPKRMLISLESVPMVPLGMREHADFLRIAGVPQPELLFAEVLRAAAGAEHDADLALFFQRHAGGIEPGFLERFV